MYLIRLLLLQLLTLSPVIIFAVAIGFLVKFKFKLSRSLYVFFLVFNIVLLVLSILAVTVFEIGVFSALGSGSYLSHTS